MSKNDGGDPIRLSKAEIDRPRIPRGIVMVPGCPSDHENRPVAGDLADFSLLVHDGLGAAYEARYHGARVVAVEDGDNALFDVGPDVVVTWERI